VKRPDAAVFQVAVRAVMAVGLWSAKVRGDLLAHVPRRAYGVADAIVTREA